MNEIKDKSIRLDKCDTINLHLNQLLHLYADKKHCKIVQHVYIWFAPFIPYVY